MKRNAYINSRECISPLGMDIVANMKNLYKGISSLKQHQFGKRGDSFFISVMEEELLNEYFTQKISYVKHFSKLEKMLLLAMHPLLEKHRPNNRTALILSTTKGNIRLLEESKNTDELRLSVLANKIASYYGFSSPPIVISNACVSGLLSVAVAKRLIENNIYDEVCIVAGDEISTFVLSGFQSFQALSPKACQPFDAKRIGINIGEASAAVWISSQYKKGDFQILGESCVNDANHISGPSRTGEGLFRCIQNAMNEAQVGCKDLDYISAHGTATQYNDNMESMAIARSGLSMTPVNSLKGYYGHTLGAAGLLESIIAMENATANYLIPSKGFEEQGTTEPLHVITENTKKNIFHFMKTSSGFGGCNTAVIFKKIT